ncbi:MAG: RNA polymerase sigma factor [Bryobacteraceae bacterium]
MNGPAAGETILAAIVRGDSEAWTSLYRSHAAAVYRFGLAMCGSASLAEEATQETFVAVMKQASNYDRSRGTVQAWLLGIARHKILRLLNAEGRQGRVNVDDRGPAVDRDAAPAFERERMAAEVRKAVMSLPANYREAVVLCELEEVDYEMAAQVLDCPIGTVRSRLHRARRMLAAKLEHLRPEGKGAR